MGSHSPEIHLSNDEMNEAPWCLHRQANRAKPLVRVIGSGQSLAVAETIGVNFCLDCLAIVQQGHADAYE